MSDLQKCDQCGAVFGPGSTGSLRVMTPSVHENPSWRTPYVTYYDFCSAKCLTDWGVIRMARAIKAAT